jgi:hypothetical protein
MDKELKITLVVAQFVRDHQESWLYIASPFKYQTVQVDGQVFGMDTALWHKQVQEQKEVGNPFHHLDHAWRILGLCHLFSVFREVNAVLYQ